MHSNGAKLQFPSERGKRELVVYSRMKGTKGMFAKEEVEKLV